MTTRDQDHQHDWQLRPGSVDELLDSSAQHAHLDAFVCAGCEETTAACSDCGRPVEVATRTICARCLERAIEVIDDCEAAYAAIPENARTVLGLRAVRYDAGPRGTASEAPLPFGLGADEDDIGELTAQLTRATAGTVIHLMRDERNVMAVLEDWANDWAERFHRPWDASVSVFGYLRTYSLWAAQNHPAWQLYRHEVRDVRSKLQSIAGTTPLVELAPCPNCGGRVVRAWSAKGLEDDRRCTRCRRVWSTEDELLIERQQVLAAAPSTNPDLLVTRDDARRLLPGLRADLLRQVLARDRRRADPEHRDYDPAWQPRLPERGVDRAGQPLYRLSDVHQLVAQDQAPRSEQQPGRAVATG